MTSDVALAIDLGGTKAEAALVDSTGSVVAASRARAATGNQASSDVLLRAVRSVALSALAALAPGQRCIGVGIGAAGPVALERGAVSPLNLPAWRGFPLRDEVQRIVAPLLDGVPVTLRMDGLCITLAEHWVGATRGYANSMGMIVSTGVGGGLILHGKTVTGPTGNAGHIGHLEVGGFDDHCECGGSGCVEAIASGPKTVAWARSQGWTGSSGEELAAAYALGNPVAIAAVARSGRAIGRAIASATSLVDLEVVAIGGGFSHVTPDIFDYIREPIAERAQFGFVRKVRVVPSALSGDGPLIGSAALIHRAELLD